MSFNIRTAASLLALALMPTVAGAQDPGTPPQGLWLELAGGAGSMRLSCAICDPSRDLGPTFSGAVGSYAGPNIRVGLEGGAWANDDDGDVRESVFRAGFVAHLHPRPGSGLHLVGGAGWTGYRAELFSYDAARLTLGAGWDLPLAGGWVAGNRITLDAAAFAALKNEESTVASPVGLSVVSFGLYLRRR